MPPSKGETHLHGVLDTRRATWFPPVPGPDVCVQTVKDIAIGPFSLQGSERSVNPSLKMDDGFAASLNMDENLCWVTIHIYYTI